MIRKTGIRHYLRRPEFIVVYSLITLTMIAAICSFPNGPDEPVETNIPTEPVEPPPTEAVEVDEQDAGLTLEVKRDIANAYATLANISNFDLLDTGDFRDPIIDNWLVTTDSNGQAQLCPSGEINRGTQTCNDNACHIYVFEGSDFGPYACPESGMGDMCSLVGTSTFDECHFTIVTLSANVRGLGTWFAVTYLWDSQMTVVVAGEGQVEVTPIVELVFDGGVPPLAQMGPVERARAWGGTNVVERLPGAPETVFTQGRGDAQFLYTAPNEALEPLPIDTAAMQPRTWHSTEQLPLLIEPLRDIEPQLEPWLQSIWENSTRAQIDLGPFPEPVSEDPDEDGLTTVSEQEIGTDPLNPDSDEDQLSDGAEVLDYGTDPLNPDSDGDGLWDWGDEYQWVSEQYGSNSDPLNPDTDNDGLTDGEEMFEYSTNPLNPDTDSDGLSDGYGEYDAVIEAWGSNSDPNNPDSDNDRLSDGDEIYQTGTNPLDPDSDNDQLTDGQEISDYGTNPLNWDSDNDGLSDYQDEYLWVSEVYGSNSNPNNPDTDRDRLSDGDEMLELSTNPLIPDTDDDGVMDGEELLDFGTDPLSADSDRDGLTDGDELYEFGTNPLTPDTDGDGLSDGEELFEFSTDPTNPDTDGDELTDSEEVFEIGTDPLDWDSDDDGLSDGGGEFFWVTEVWGDHTDPLNPDTDDDGYSDGEEMDMDTNPLDPDDPYIIG
jgi:hypothetical protein